MTRHAQLTGAIIAAFYQVYGELGYGFLEKVYERAMSYELNDRGLSFRAQRPIRVRYREVLVGEYFADLLVENRVIVELKATERLLKTHSAQLLNYLKSTKYEVGLVLNFGPEPQIRRHIFDNHRKGSLSWIDDHKIGD
jgi:GxxExxY protein